MDNEIRKLIDKVKLLNESLGIPENVIESVNALFNDIIEKLHQQSHRVLADEDEDSMYIRGEYVIGNIKINTVKINLNYNAEPEIDHIELYRFNVQNPMTVDKSKNGYSMFYEHDNEPIISIFIVGPDNSITYQAIHDKLIDDKNELLGTFSHELLHKYEKNMMAKVNKGASISKYADYDTYSNIRSGIKPIDEMIFYMYYTSKIENITRPAELLATLKAGNVTKDNFQQAVKDSYIYKQLVDIKNFSFAKMVEDIKTNYVDQVNSFFDEPEYQQLPFDEKVISLLNSIFHGIGQKSTSTVAHMVRPSFLDLFKGNNDTSDRMNVVNKHARKYEKVGSNSQAFFIKKQIEMNQIADKLIKKLFKLYDLIPDKPIQENTSNSIRSIKEWELDQMVRKVPKIKYIK